MLDLKLVEVARMMRGNRHWAGKLQIEAGGVSTPVSLVYCTFCWFIEAVSCPCQYSFVAFEFWRI